MADSNGRGINVERILREMFDYERFFAEEGDELCEEQLDLISAAGNYAGFLKRLGVNPSQDEFGGITEEQK